jgi:hypothetical protein
MVKTRLSGYASGLNTAYNSALSNVGSNKSYILETKSFDSTGQAYDSSITTTTVFGDFQIIFDVKELERLGLTGTGNAKFYTKKDYTIVPKAILYVNSEKWQFRKIIEDDYWSGSKVSQIWLLVRLDG